MEWVEAVSAWDPGFWLGACWATVLDPCLVEAIEASEAVATSLIMIPVSLTTITIMEMEGYV